MNKHEENRRLREEVERLIKENLRLKEDNRILRGRYLVYQHLPDEFGGNE